MTDQPTIHLWIADHHTNLGGSQVMTKCRQVVNPKHTIKVASNLARLVESRPYPVCVQCFPDYAANGESTITEETETALRIAYTYTWEATIILRDDLVVEMESTAQNMEEHFPEKAMDVEDSLESVNGLVDYLESLEWPYEVVGLELGDCPPVTLTTAPLATRGKNKGLPKKLTTRQERQLKLDIANDWLDAAKSVLDGIVGLDVDNEMDAAIIDFRDNFEDEGVSQIDLP